VIRERSADDLDECVAMLARVRVNDGYPTHWPDDPAAWLTPPNMVLAWVAVVEGKIVGHAMVRDSGGVVSFNRLFVAPEGRGLGAAKALLAKAKQWVREQGVDRLVLDVAHTAASAIALYEQNGWRRTHSGPAEWDRAVTLHSYELS
jgi:GNAT superfamily N-acetyltransferase